MIDSQMLQIAADAMNQATFGVKSRMLSLWEKRLDESEGTNKKREKRSLAQEFLTPQLDGTEMASQGWRAGRGERG